MHHLGESGSSGGDVGRDTLSGDVGLLFVLRFCARPLAGPPVGRTDSAIAPDLQARAVFNSFCNSAEKLFEQSVAQTSLSLAESFASSIRTPPFLGRRSNHDCVTPISTFALSEKSGGACPRWRFLPPCQSAFSGRSWACPSSSTSRAELSRSL